MVTLTVHLNCTSCMAREETIHLPHAMVWRFVVQDFDPLSVED